VGQGGVRPGAVRQEVVCRRPAVVPAHYLERSSWGGGGEQAVEFTAHLTRLPSHSLSPKPQHSTPHFTTLPKKCWHNTARPSLSRPTAAGRHCAHRLTARRRFRCRPSRRPPRRHCHPLCASALAQPSTGGRLGAWSPRQQQVRPQLIQPLLGHHLHSASRCTHAFASPSAQC